MFPPERLIGVFRAREEITEDETLHTAMSVHMQLPRKFATQKEYLTQATAIWDKII
jgi:hypothetical protein